MINELPHTYNTPEIRIDCADEKKFKIIENLQKKMKELKKDYIAIDGIRYDFEDGWWLIRASNTQPILVSRIEATSKESIKREFKALQELLESEGVILQSSALSVDS